MALPVTLARPAVRARARLGRMTLAARRAAVQDDTLADVAYARIALVVISAEGALRGLGGGFVVTVTVTVIRAVAMVFTVTVRVVIIVAVPTISTVVMVAMRVRTAMASTIVVRM